MTEIIKKQIGENPPTFKVVLFAIKAVCGVVGGSLVVIEHPYIGLAVFAIGAAADQIITLKNWK
jgi:hypothetical protein